MSHFMADRNVEFTGSIPVAYDRYLGPMLFEPYAADLAARLGSLPIAAALEVAAGTGILTAQLRHAIPARAVLTATDLNDPMLEFARAKLPGLGITWQRADAQELPFSDASFDVVACQFGIMFVPDKARAFVEARRVLRPHGQLAFNVWGPLADNPVGRIAHDVIGQFFSSDPPTFYEVPFGFHDEAMIRQLLRAANFDVVGCHAVSLEARSASALDAARGLVTGNPIHLAVTERATAPVDEIIEALAAALAAEGGGAPFRLPMRALVVVARAA
jgi:ubiquinone/menaquinone biosynthesis C-methylase UbiE